MKKIIAALTLLGAVLSLTSCSKKNNQQAEETTVPSTVLLEEEADCYADKISKGMMGSVKEFDSQEREEIKSALEKKGYTVVFNEDGSGVLSNEDGQWNIGRGWEDNEYTKGVPAVDFGTVTMSAEEKDSEKGDSYIFLIRDSNAAQAEKYVAALEKAGYERDKDNTVIDVENGVVQFIGTNSDGKRIETAYSSFGFTLRIYK